MEHEIWTYEDVAAYLRLKNVGAARSLAYSDPNFPKPIPLGHRTRRFFAAEVKNYARGKGNRQSKRGRPAIASKQK